MQTILCHFQLILIDFYRDNWKEVLNQRFTELKKQIENIRLVCSKKAINEDSKCEVIEDNKYSDLDEDCIGGITNESEIDVFISLSQKIENLEKNFFHANQNKMINEKIFYLFGHLLLRTFDKMIIYLNNYDLSTQQYSEKLKNIKNVLIQREKQFQRLFSTNMLTNDDNDMLEFEITLQNRINELKLSQSKEPSFVELKANCLQIFESYIRQCINFHSTLKVNGICGNFDEFVEYVFEQKIHMNEKERKLIELSCAHFDIPLVNPQIVCRKKLQYRQNKSENFLPSQHIDHESIDQEKEIDINFIDLIKSIRNDRWTVLLGSAGSGKTTFVRWLICQFARALCIEDKNIIVNGVDMGPVRIPILIRIGEFAQWLEEDHPSSNLFDYIGHHTWFGHNYVSDGFEMLKDFVRYGHAFIILDGLDEVATTELHNRVIALVRAFIQSYCMSHEFISPFDDALIAKEEFEYDFRCEGLFGGKYYPNHKSNS